MISEMKCPIKAANQRGWNGRQVMALQGRARPCRHRGHPAQSGAQFDAGTQGRLDTRRSHLWGGTCWTSRPASHRGCSAGWLITFPRSLQGSGSALPSTWHTAFPFSVDTGENEGGGWKGDLNGPAMQRVKSLPSFRTRVLLAFTTERRPLSVALLQPGFAQSPHHHHHTHSEVPNESLVHYLVLEASLHPYIPTHTHTHLTNHQCLTYCC